MNFSRLLLRSLRFHWRGNLAVGLGVAVGTAVLTGALLVGDSLRGTLRDLTLSRLGWVDFSLVTGRLFNEERAAPSHYAGATRVAPAILLRGSAARGDAGRVNNVVILGVDDRFWEGAPPVSADYWKAPDIIDLPSRSVVLGGPLARDLAVKPGDTVTLRFEKVTAAPRESLLGKRQAKDVLAALELKVAAVLPDDHPGSAFSLSPSPEAPRNAYLPLAILQDEVRSQVRPARSLPERPINAVLVQGGNKEQLDGALARQLTLGDWGMALRERPRYLSLESRQTFLEPGAESAGERLGLRAAPTLVYLVNNVATAEQHALAAAASIAPPSVLPIPQTLAAYYGPVQLPYSIVAALDPAQAEPLGPFLPPGRTDLKDDEILLVDWLKDSEEFPLKGARPGAPVVVTYFEPGDEGRLQERSVRLRLAGVAPMEGPFDDRNLTPEFPGVTDVRTMEDWKEQAPFPFDESRLKARDHKYWTAHRATPKAYVTLKTGQKLWSGRFGGLTSVRLAPVGGGELKAEAVESRLVGLFRPERGGFVFDDVRRSRLESSQGGMDFGVLFLGFSFFLIAAALLFVGLLFRLSIDRRAAEVGLLLAVGLRGRSVRRLLVAEGAFVAALGGLVGLVAAVGYTWLTLRSLGANWPAGLGQDFFGLHVTPASLAIGYIASLVVSVLTITWAARGLVKVSPRALLLGETEEAASSGPVRLRWSKWLMIGGAVGAATCLIFGTLVSGHMAKAISFFVGGALLLTAGLALVWALLRKQAGAQAATPAAGLGRLAIRNAARNPGRSLLTAGLLASASFVVVAVTAFHRDPGRDFLRRDGGSGGFPLLAEAEVPIYQDLNTPKGLAEAGVAEEDLPRLAGVQVAPLRVRAGDDASCLNLFQPRRPRVIGVPPSLVRRGGFQFGATEATTPEEKANPWLLLQRRRDDGAVPVFGETNTVTWMLKSGLGGELTVPDGQGNSVRLRIVGLLKDSVFQGELLTSEAHFLTLYPRQEGYQMFLIDPGAAGAAEVRRTLEKALGDRGLTVSESVRRLESYLAVENTYLATFQGLGRLGLLLGVLGLAVVLLRGVWERRAELALLRALGLRNAKLGRLILTENAVLLAAGLSVGLAAGLLSVAPHLLGGAGEGLPRLVGFLAAVAAVGLAAGALAVWSTLRAPLLPALRRE